MLAAADVFEKAHGQLSARYEGDDSSNPSNHALYLLYSSGNNPLDTEAQTFIKNVKKLATIAPSSLAQSAILSQIFSEARQPLLFSLDRVVTIHQQESERKLKLLERLQWIILSVVLLTLLVEGMTIFRPMVRRIVNYTAQILRFATTDMLTSTANRRHFMERAENECARARRYGRPLTILMLDADHFKKINDTYGHAAGDEVLKILSLELRKALRPADIIGRIGGEEFAILLPETPVANAIELATRLNRLIDGVDVAYGKKNINFTVSIGVAAVPLHPTGIDEALKTADEYLYAAKHKGRNCVMPEAAY